MATATKAPVRSAARHRGESLVRLGLKPDRWDYLVALAGNPNVGKSTVFNALTGMRQHTGNWPGKTVARAEGAFAHNGQRVKVVDLPGTYSLQAGSADEEIARDFIVFGRPDVTVVVVDATRLERNLNLVLQVMEITDRVVVCLNLIDEARRHGVAVDAARLEARLGVPVVPAVARRGEGIEALLQAVEQVATGARPTTPYRLERHAPEVESAVSELVPAIERAYPRVPNPRWVALRLLNGDEAVATAVRDGELGLLTDGARLPGRVGAELGGGPDPAAAAVVDPAAVEPAAIGLAAVDLAAVDSGAVDLAAVDTVLETASRLRWGLRPEFHDALMARLYGAAEEIAAASQVQGLKRAGLAVDHALDRAVTSRWLGFPIMLALLALVFWITIEGSNVPSHLLTVLLVEMAHPWLVGVGTAVGLPWWLNGFLFDGIYLATAWVVAVMLPPMAIFFPLFTLLEDFGYLPRVAFNMDALFRRAGAHGKQALTMCMGFGCNAAGVVSTRVIDSPRERLIAIITNNFSLCNGRWPTQILIATIFIGALAPAHLAGLVSAAAVVGIALLGVFFMFIASWALSRTVLRGEASTFSLELPPYRPPRILQTLYTSVIDRTLIVLGRAVMFAVPAGAAIWLISNISVGGTSMAEHLVVLLDPVGLLIGLNGVILLAYVVAIPANEIVIPTILMLTVLTAGLADVGGGAGVMFELESASAMGEVLQVGGWTLLTGVCLMLFSLLHNPCSTTIYTIYKETGSARWTAVAALLPLVMGVGVCFVVAQLWGLV